MIKSEYNERIEEYARSLPDGYDAFSVVMGTLPQKHGVDRELWDWVESEGSPTFDELSLRYCEMMMKP